MDIIEEMYNQILLYQLDKIETLIKIFPGVTQ